ncbi:MAG: transketolase [Bacteroidales bacterium]|nr:transketolase [Bacteroidales bacterium]
MDDQNLKELQNMSRSIRQWIIRSLAEAGSGHTGGSLGLSDVFTYLYFKVMKHRPNQPDWEGRDHLILSIGHVAPVFYSTLAHAGYFHLDELLTLRKLGSRLQGHPGKDHGLPGIELSSGSLGQGLSVGVGLAISKRINNNDTCVFVVMGDGELQEGSVWEAAMSASHHKLNRLIAIVDRNGLQIDGKTSDVMEIEPLKQKWESFGWKVLECDGNNFADLETAFDKAISNVVGPVVIIARTIMGKGIPSIENDYRWHGKVPSREQAIEFQKDLEDL